jgi:hypothetical protein
VRLLAAALTLRELSAHCVLLDGRWSRPLRWLVIAPLVNYSGAASEKPEAEEFEVVRPWAPDTVWWHTGQSSAPDQGSLRFILLLSF